MNNFNGDMECAKLVLSSVIAFIMSHFGTSVKPVVVLICFMAADTIIGWLVAKHLNVWQSSKARWGFAGKIVELMFVAMLYLLDWLFVTDCLKYIGIYYFIICEGASFVENIAKVNKNIPQGLAELLKAIKVSAGTSIVNYVKNMINK